MGFNNNDDQKSLLRDIQIAKLGFIGASIATIGDGISAIAAGLAVEALENSIDQRSRKQTNLSKQLRTKQESLDNYINELIQIRKRI